MVWTVIIKMGEENHFVKKVDDIESFVLGKRGFYAQKRNKNIQPKLIFSVGGDYVKPIRSFGVNKFAKMLRNYNPVGDTIRSALY